MTPAKFHLVNGKVKDNACAAIQTAPIGWVVTLAKPSRSAAQNALLHKWYGEIARHKGDSTMLDVKGECHRKYGLAIRQRNPQFAYVWKRSGAHLTYDQQCKFLASGVLNVSSAMTVDELSEYMTAMAQDYRAEGVKLTDPEDRKWTSYEAAN